MGTSYTVTPAQYRPAVLGSTEPSDRSSKVDKKRRDWTLLGENRAKIREEPTTSTFIIGMLEFVSCLLHPLHGFMASWPSSSLRLRNCPTSTVDAPAVTVSQLLHFMQLAMLQGCQDVRCASLRLSWSLTAPCNQ